MVDEQLSYSSKAALTERVKELTCLYGIAPIARQPDISLEEIIQGIVELLPPAWQYPISHPLDRSHAAASSRIPANQKGLTVSQAASPLRILAVLSFSKVP